MVKSSLQLLIYFHFCDNYSVIAYNHGGGGGLASMSTSIGAYLLT